MSKPIVMERGVKYRDADKMALIPVKNVATEREALLRKPEWMKIKLPADSSRIQGIKAAMRKNGLHSVCEEASCPNLAECFNHGTATFMILRRDLYPPLPILRRRAWPPGRARCERATEAGANYRRYGAALRGGHLGGP
ncbi:lipoate synthase [Klebsiella quasipneumoniae]|nr:lipoate synthase [Klebsiella quasipneumoniae]